MKLIKISILSISIIGLLFSCGQKKFEVPEKFLQPDELVQLMVEMHLVDGYLHQSLNTIHGRKDSAFLIYPAILQKYDISRQMLDSTILFYGKHPDEFNKIYDEVLVQLSRKSGEVQEQMKNDSIQHIDE